jgi:hypothetical protein
VAAQLLDIVGRTPHFRNVRVAADNSRGTLLVTGPKAFLDIAHSVTKTLDTPAQRVQLEFALLYAGPPSASEADRGPLRDLSAPMPPDLQDLAKELARFGETRLLARLTAVAVEDEEFSVEGMIGGEAQVLVHGTIQQANPDGAVRMKISAEAISTDEAHSHSTQWVEGRRIGRARGPHRTVAAVSEGDGCAMPKRSAGMKLDPERE